MKTAARATPLAGLLLLGCGGTELPRTVGEDPTDVPLRAATADQVARFAEGDLLFDATFRAPDGLGPLYIRASCGACHRDAGKGPGAVEKMAIVLADGVTPGDPSPLAFGPTVRPQLAPGAMTAVLPPDGPQVKRTLRVGVAVFGRGYLEAIDDAEILRVEAEQARAGAVSGRANRVRYGSEENPGQPFHRHRKGEADLVGRFGVKARIATLDEFAADAAQGDMGMTSRLRPTELPNPDGITDDEKPGPDLGYEEVNALADYVRLLEIPRRAPPSSRAPGLFAAAGCADCHVPSLRTRPDYPIAPLAGIDAPIFSDLLLHDMGDALADGLTDGTAASREWRTAPLLGLRHFRGYLHDSRAATIEEAIEAHGAPGSEGAASAARYRALSAEDRAELLRYVSSL